MASCTDPVLNRNGISYCLSCELGGLSSNPTSDINTLLLSVSYLQYSMWIIVTKVLTYLKKFDTISETMHLRWFDYNRALSKYYILESQILEYCFDVILCPQIFHVNFLHLHWIKKMHLRCSLWNAMALMNFTIHLCTVFIMFNYTEGIYAKSFLQHCTPQVHGRRNPNSIILKYEKII